MTHDASVVIFITQLVVLLVAGRIAGELAQRVGQPPVLGQIIAGVLLGPSLFGVLAPDLWHSLFSSAPEQRAMLDAVAQLGIVLLLLMTGMDTDLSVFRDARRAALSISLSGIVVPFACGYTRGALLPDALLPSPPRRVISALFLGTALSISSVKIGAWASPPRLRGVRGARPLRWRPVPKPATKRRWRKRTRSTSRRARTP